MCFSSSLQSTAQYLYKRFWWELLCFFYVGRNSDSPEIPKYVNIIDLSRFRHSISLQATGLIFSFKFLSDHSENQQNFSIKKFFCLVRASDFWYSEDSIKRWTFWFISIFNFNFLTSYRFVFFPQVLERQLKNLNKNFWLKNLYLWSLGWNFDCLKLPKNFNVLTLSRSWNMIPSIVKGLISFVNFSIDSSNLVQES